VTSMCFDPKTKYSFLVSDKIKYQIKILTLNNCIVLRVFKVAYGTQNCSVSVFFPCVRNMYNVLASVSVNVIFPNFFNLEVLKYNSELSFYIGISF